MLKISRKFSWSIWTVEYVSFKDSYTVRQAIDYYRKVAIDKEETDICFCRQMLRKISWNNIIKNSNSIKRWLIYKRWNGHQFQVSGLTKDDQEEIAALFRKYDFNYYACYRSWR